jgi:hypothetical protein
MVGVGVWEEVETAIVQGGQFLFKNNMVRITINSD